MAPSYLKQSNAVQRNNPYQKTRCLQKCGWQELLWLYEARVSTRDSGFWKLVDRADKARRCLLRGPRPYNGSNMHASTKYTLILSSDGQAGEFGSFFLRQRSWEHPTETYFGVVLYKQQKYKLNPGDNVFTERSAYF